MCGWEQVNNENQAKHQLPSIEEGLLHSDFHRLLPFWQVVADVVGDGNIWDGANISGYT